MKNLAFPVLHSSMLQSASATGAKSKLAIVAITTVLAMVGSIVPSSSYAVSPFPSEGTVNQPSARTPNTLITPWPDTLTVDFPPPWQVQYHPKIKAHTQFNWVVNHGQVVLSSNSDASYGTLVHPFSSPAEVNQLQWSWRVIQHPLQADLKRKEGDDAAAKVCVFVAIDESKLGLGTRMKLGSARVISGERLPAATLCYVWASQGVKVGEVFNNPFTDRVRNLVVRVGEPPSELLVAQQRDIQADARKVFGAELPDGPVKLLGVALGTDADNTGTKAQALFGTLSTK